MVLNSRQEKELGGLVMGFYQKKTPTSQLMEEFK